MKSFKYFLSILFFFAVANTAVAQNSKLDGPFLRKKSFKVEGSCDLCKRQIEKAAKQEPGVRWASWNPDTHMLLVEYMRTKTDPEKIQQRIAANGHNTEKFKGETAVGGKGQDCCHHGS